MLTLSVKQLCEATQGQLKTGFMTAADCEDLRINNVSTDTRSLQPNDLFIALKGPSFDAHQLLPQAIEKGAAVVLVASSSTLNIASDNVVIEVQDTRIALGLLGRYIKQQLKQLKCAAITGSNGKTTCKELLSAILTAYSGDAEKVLATAGNFNNDIGLPLTLLRLQSQHQFAVVELGANHIGEIAYTSRLAQPDVALVNNIMPAHLEGFGSLQGVATAKAEIWSHLSPNGVAVVNLDADFSEQFVQQLEKENKKRLGFSKEASNKSNVSADVFATDITFNALGQGAFILNVNVSEHLQSIAIQLNLPGKHNISNALAASTMAIALGCDLISIQQGLNNVQQVAGRVNSAVISQNLIVIDDTYNANSASVNAGIDLLSQYQGEHLLVLGDMGELGEFAEQEHQNIGEYAQKQGIERLFTVGNLSQHTTSAYNASSKTTNAQHFFDKATLQEAISSYLTQQSNKVIILVKGSRSAKMEEIVSFIKNEFGA